MVVGGDGAGTGGALFPNVDPSLFSNLHSSQVCSLYSQFSSLFYWCVTTQRGWSRVGSGGKWRGTSGWKGGEGGERFCERRETLQQFGDRKERGVKRAWENAGWRRRGLDWNKGIWKSKKHQTSAVGVDTNFSRGEGDYQGTLGGEGGLARVVLIHLSAYTKTRRWSLYLLRPDYCSLQLLPQETWPHCAKHQRVILE